MSDKIISDSAPRTRFASAVRRVWGWVRRLPCWVTAPLLVLMVLLLDYERPRDWREGFGLWGNYVNLYVVLTGLVLFLPGGIRQGSWRRCLISLVFALVAMAITVGADRLALMAWRARPYSGFDVPVMLISLAQWPFLKPRSLRSLGWLFLCGLAAGSIATAITFHLSMHQYRPDFVLYFSFRSDIASLVSPLVWGVLAWAGIGLAGWGIHKVRAKTAVCVAAVGILILPLFTELAIFPWARQSIQNDSPYPRHMSAWLLASRGTKSDMDSLWVQLEAYDWSTHDRHKSNGPIQFCRTLYWNDPDGTAKRLAAMVRARPNRNLVVLASAFTTHSGDFEFLPLLMRYAWLYERSDLSWCAIDIMESAKLPEAYYMILRDRGYGHGRTGEYAVLGAETHSRLVMLTGKDVGNKTDDWWKLEDQTKDMPSPVPEEIREKVRRTTDLCIIYMEKANLLEKMQRALVARADVNPYRLSVPHVDAMVAGVNAQAAGKLATNAPDLDVLSVDTFEAQVKRYAAAVDALAERCFPSATPASQSQPASAPASTAQAPADGQ